MSQAKREERDRVRESIKAFLQHEAQLSRDLGEEPYVDLVKKHRAEDQAVELFDRMTPSEMLDLYYSDRDRWRQVMEAKRQAGMRQLFEQNS